MRVLRRLTVDDAIALYQRLYERGRHGHAPHRGDYAWMTEHGERWVIAAIPLDHLNFQTAAESGPDRIARARRYAELRTPFPPGADAHVEAARPTFRTATTASSPPTYAGTTRSRCSSPSPSTSHSRRTLAGAPPHATLDDDDTIGDHTRRYAALRVT